ncbi:MAG: epoxyqueuosine reductase [Desulfotomaculaceae bacterium]|nr:epoxyqueuosine reductase [Desulfotomaculaceae bacterium]MDD4766727.1 epoxyqueuosine reductase [Desulfotomaculaceae bacterium]
MKEDIIKFASSRGADIIGFAGVDRWPEYNEIPPEFWPTSLWSMAKTVIVMGMQMPLPIVDTTPSILHRETYETSNRELDSLAYGLTRYLNKAGQASMFFPRDGYGSIKNIIDKPYAAFSHTFAAKYAGLGTVSRSHNLLTPEYGSRVRLVSVFTAAELEVDHVMEKDLCINCKLCVKCCPAKVLLDETSAVDYYFKLDPIGCARWHEELTRRRAYPCGICTKVCPVGKDRYIYQEKDMSKIYRSEQKALENDINHPEYKSWNHFRRYGSWAIKNGKIFNYNEGGEK